jgi:hypothetical protein
VSCFLVIKTRRVAMPLLLIEVVFATVALAAYAALGVVLGIGS